MQIRFLLGPAGCGKTYRCLAEIGDALRESPEGPPLLLLAPKQATFQLERQLLSAPGLRGYTRLQILSFDRLAGFILGEFAGGSRPVLTEEGRVMALRSLLGRLQPRLKIFHSTARLPGFAQQLNLLLREFQRQQLSPGRLASLADRLQGHPGLAGKLHDSALLLDAYLDWLQGRGLQDGNRLIDLAADSLRKKVSSGRERLRVGGLWLDGFAEMTPQELDLLAAFLPICDRATLAFCLDAGARESSSWLSGWAVLDRTYHECRRRAAEVKGSEVAVEWLKRDPERNRFRGQPVLQQLEETWAGPGLASPDPAKPGVAEGRPSSLRVVACADPESEATLAAREIFRFARDGGRFRDVAVLLRRLEGYEDVFRRVFSRYGIPFYLDRREPVAHHALAELTRYALRLAAFGWRHEDLFGALKTGLVTDDDAGIDRLENEALARGWQGNVWFQPLKLPREAEMEKAVNRWLEKILPPFMAWNAAMASVQRRPNGIQLAAALRKLWDRLAVEETLEEWSAESPALNEPGLRGGDGTAGDDGAARRGRADSQAGPAGLTGSERSAVHLTVLEQMNAWLDNAELAFGEESMPLADWLPVLEAGLAGLTVGVIPPALDQVLIGAIDRSRNPELRLALLPGWNESVFPSLPEPGPLLTETERDLLAGQDVPIGLGRRQQIGHERYYAYIACTRARERLVITRAARDAEGQLLYPSPFLDRVRQIAGAAEEMFDGPDDWRESECICELEATVLRAQAAPAREPALDRLAQTPALAPLVSKWRKIQQSSGAPRLSPGVAEDVYGRDLHGSVSGLEDFAACPFKFFAARGLRLQERKEFQFDDRDKGSFQHEALREFHSRIRGSGRRWRDLSPGEARDLVVAIGHELMPGFAGGRFLAGSAARFTGGYLIERLGRLVSALIGWMPQYEFDPERVEVSFGLEQDGLAAWRIGLRDNYSLLLRGRIDRVDVCRLENGSALAVVMDYKSSPRSLNSTKLHHGLELQLLSYLGVLRHIAGPEAFSGAATLLPAGVFYVPLNGGAGRSGATRTEVLGGAAAAGRAAYQHSGRFLAEALEHFDNRGLSRGDQFKFAKKKDGSLSARGNDAVPGAEFEALGEQVEGHLRDYGCRIFDGEAEVSPFRIGSQTACDRCDFRSVCRFDPWTQPFRELRPPPKPRREAVGKKDKTAGAKQ